MTDTYHLLVSPLKFSNCGELPSKIVCTQKNEVTSDKIYSFNIDDWIDFYGPRTYAYGQEPEVLNIAMTTFSSRPFTEAEITYTHNMRKQRIEELDKWWSGLSNVNIDALDMLANSASYAEMKKDEYRPTAAGNLLVDNIDIYKELFYQGLESNSNKLLEDAVNLIPGLPNAYMGLASLEDDPIKKYLPVFENLKVLKENSNSISDTQDIKNHPTIKDLLLIFFSFVMFIMTYYIKVL